MVFQIFDIFGIGIGLRYLNKQQYKTGFGAIITVVILSLICLQIAISSQELFEKKNPEVIFAERYVSTPERFDIKRNSFNFAFGVQQPKTFKHYIDESIYKVEASMIKMTKKLDQKSNSYIQDWQTLPIKVHPCTQTDFEVKESQEYFNTLPGLNNMYCVDYDSQELYIEGNFDQDKYGFLQLKFFKCKDNTNCKSITNINEQLTNSFVAFYTNDIVINPKDYHPFSTISRDFFWNTSPNIGKEVQMYFRNSYVESDKGIFFEQKSYDRSTSFSFLTENLIFNEENNFFSLIIRFEKQKESLYHRKYKKLDRLLAEIGGISKTLIIIGFLICIPVNQLQLHEQLSNSLFQFGKNTKKQQEDQNEQQKDSSKLVQILQDTQTINKSQNPETRNTLMLAINKLQNNKDTTLKSNFFKIQEESIQNFNNEKDNPISIDNSVNYFVNNVHYNEKKIDKNENYENENHKKSSQDIDFVDNKKKISISNNIQPQSPQLSGINLLNIIKSVSKRASSIHQKQQEVKSTFKKQKSQINQSAQNVKDMFRQDKQKENQLHLSWTDYIKYYIWPYGKFSQKKKQIDYSVESLYKHLDILYIIQKLLEIEKLKQLLLDEDQIQLIQFFTKPIIDVDEIDKQKKGQTNKNKVFPMKQLSRSKTINMLNSTQQDETQKAKQAFQALKNIISKQKLTEIDKKVIEMLDESILEDIENNADYLQQFEEFHYTEQSDQGQGDPNIILEKNDKQSEIGNLNLNTNNKISKDNIEDQTQNTRFNKQDIPKDNDSIDKDVQNLSNNGKNK